MSRRAQQILGLLALAASLLFLGRLAWLRTASLPPVAWTPAGLAAAAVAVGLSLVCVLAGALAWFLLLRSGGSAAGRPSLRAVLAIFALAQAGKYIPGNVGQYFGRAVLARRQGVALRDSAFTLLVETAGLVLAAVACGALAGGALPGGGRLALMAVAAVAAPCLFLFGVRRLVPRLRNRLPTAWREKLGDGPLPVPSAAALTACLALYVLSFCSGGTALHLLARGLFAAPPGGWARTVPAFALAWVAGFVTPGAPGGLGVREALLVAGTAPVYGPGTALSAALALRAVTVLGDGLALLAGLAFRPRARQEST
ncbi:MAG TPA: lysylphosphatidylglycerol synthase domain-containing protein [Thermoanaerobaculia bacterium]|jgi:hypothetical protein|nr:lysylphosphatidylglycerol synthase domain-containing protein [Thermoanaerobaculia bacterium]